MERIATSLQRRSVPPDDPALLIRGTDPRTGLLTPAALFEIVARRAEAADHLAHPFALVLVALDNAAGQPPRSPAQAEALLPAVARRLRGRIRGADLAIGLGAGRYAILMPGPTAEAEAEGLAVRLVEMMRRPFLLEDEMVSTACRVGVALFPADAWEPEQLLRAAEAALGEARADAGARRHASACLTTPGWQRRVA